MIFKYLVYLLQKNKQMPKFKDYNQGRHPALFPLDLELLVPKKHLARQIDAVIDRIKLDRLQEVFSDEGASSYHPQMMLKIIIYSYAKKNYSCRNIAAMLRQDVICMWLSGMQTPDFNTVNRFRSKYLIDVIEDVFTEVLMFLNEHGFIKFKDYFVDGTKLEADTRKHSQVWKSNTQRFKEAVQSRIKTLMAEIDKINSQEDKIYDNQDLPEIGEQSNINSDQVEAVARGIIEKINEKQESIKKEKIQKIKGKVSKLNKEKESLKKYEEQEAILGTRNSYSKTDHDATMMRMKGTDELRPGYNAQISSENQFVTNYSANQNAADSACFGEHLEKIIERGEAYTPDNYVGDCGYGSQENYDALESAGINNYLKYQTFNNELDSSKKDDFFERDSYEYDSAGDFYICPNKVKLPYTETRETKTVNGYPQTFRVYVAESCANCPLKDKCTKSPGNRKLFINLKLERHKKIARENLHSEKGIEFRKRRGPEIETFFGDLKHNQQYRRIRLRGLKKANLELGYLSISYNLRKATIKLAKKAA